MKKKKKKKNLLQVAPVAYQVVILEPGIIKNENTLQL